MSVSHRVLGIDGEVRCVHPDTHAMQLCSMPPFAQSAVPASDPVKHPSHYMLANGIECIDVVQHFNFNRGGAIKYVWRSGKKSTVHEIEDLEKARELLTFEIERLRNEQG